MNTRAVLRPNKRAVVSKCFCSFLGLRFCIKVGIRSLLGCSFVFHTDSVVSVVGSRSSKVCDGFLKRYRGEGSFSQRGMKSCISDDTNFSLSRTTLFTQVCLAIDRCCSCASSSWSELKQWKGKDCQQASNGGHSTKTPVMCMQECSVQHLQLVEGCICCHSCSDVPSLKETTGN